MIYVATPYSHKDPEIVEQRVRIVNKYTTYLFNKGIFAFSPISHCHHLAMDYGLPTDFKFWENYNKHMISLSEGVHFLEQRGWTESVGYNSEMRIVIELEKSYSIIHPETFEVLT